MTEQGRGLSADGVAPGECHVLCDFAVTGYHSRRCRPAMPGRGLSVDGFLREWSKHENAPRTVCPDCHFESSEGYPPSHAPDCPKSAPASSPSSRGVL